MRVLSVKALTRLCDDLGQLINQYEALRKQILTLHMQGGGTAQGAFYIGVAQTLARGIQQDMDILSNAIYNLTLQAEQQKEHEPANPKPATVAGQKTRETAQADPRSQLGATEPGTSDVRDQLATEAVDQHRSGDPVV